MSIVGSTGAAGPPRGRTGVFELLPMTAELRRLLNARAGEDAILAAARGSGLSTLSEEALKLVRAGTTTLEEIARLFPEIEVPGETSS